MCVSCYSPCRPVAGFTNLCPSNLYDGIRDQDTILRVVIHEISHALVRFSNCQLGPQYTVLHNMCNQNVFCTHCSAQWFMSHNAPLTSLLYVLIKTPNVTGDVISLWDGMLNHESFQGNNINF